MVEHPPPPKSDEQHPLLKVESGGGDSGRPPAPSLTGNGWNVNCTPKRAWIDRWPELFSACWMTGMLLGIFVIIIYGLGTMGVIRRPPLFMVNCNDSKPASQVYYHYLIEEGVDVPFKKLSEYLTYMGTQYHALRFNVIFLIVSNSRNRYRRSPIPFYLKIKQTGGTINDLRLFRDFHLKYHNINITIMSLPKFMAMTPWRFKWKRIPLPNLIFYLRVYSVWQNGGISMDLDTFSHQHFTQQLEDPVITAVLRQHNDGIKLEEYSYTLNKFDRDEQNDFVSLFYGILHQILGETRAFLNKTLTYSENYIESNISKPFIRVHRDKRELTETDNNASNDTSTSASTIERFNTTDISILDSSYQNTDHNTDHDLAINHNSILSSIFGKYPPLDNKTEILLNGIEESDENKTNLKVVKADPEGTQVLLLYDFSIFSDNLGPPYLSSEMAMPTNLSPTHVDNYYEQDQEPPKTVSPPKKSLSFLLSITSDGSFIAATSKQHPFLGHIISTACQRMPPRFAIQDAMLTQCPTLSTDSVYCNSIHIL